MDRVAIIRKQKAKINLPPILCYASMVELPIALGRTVAAGVDVVGLGVNTIDLLAMVGPYPDPDSKQPLDDFLERPGGEAATAMTACARLGWRARYIGRFGNDSRGRAARASLERERVDLSESRDVAAPQSCSLILVDDQGRRTILWRRSAALDMAASDVDPVAVCSGRVLLVDGHQVAAATRAAVCARRAGIPTVIDVDCDHPDIEGLLAEVDLIIAAQGFPESFTGVSGLGAALTALNQRFKPALVCATLGSEGSLAIAGDTEIRTPGFDVPVVDTTGAGDVFRGGLIAGWLGAGSRPSAEEVLTYANAVAALSCRAIGARTAIPSRIEVDALLAATGRQVSLG